MLCNSLGRNSIRQISFCHKFTTQNMKKKVNDLNLENGSAQKHADSGNTHICPEIVRRMHTGRMHTGRMHTGGMHTGRMHTGGMHSS